MTNSSADAVAVIRPPSGRKGSRKVRTGCITCKIRKVKCDEGKPYCIRCVKTGRACDGYPPKPGSILQSVKRLAPSPTFLTVQERTAYEYYRNHARKIFTSNFDPHFWNGTVVHLSITEPAVRHAILAVSGLHRHIEAGESGQVVLKGAESNLYFAFDQYSKAVSCLRDWVPPNEVSALPLLVCILFVWFEFLADRETTSQMHICQGRHILSGLPDAKTPTMDLIKETLVPVYTRLSLGSIPLGSRPELVPDHLLKYERVPGTFSDFQNATIMLHILMDKGLQFTVKAGLAIYNPNTTSDELRLLAAQQEHLLVEMSRWHSAFAVLATYKDKMQPFLYQRDMCFLYYHGFMIWLTTALCTQQLAFDKCIPHFASIINVATNICDHRSRAREHNVFSFEAELIPVVYYTATRCRHPILRRVAVRLLARSELHTRREIHWNASCSIAIATRVIEWEEGTGHGIYGEAVDSKDPLGGLTASLKPDGRRPAVVREPALVIEEFGEDHLLSDVQLPIHANRDVSPEGNFDDNNSSTTSGSPPSTRDSLSPVPDLPLENPCLESPFGVPEHRRLKNIGLGPKGKGGTWVTFFEAPDPGEDRWKVTREFIRHAH